MARPMVAFALLAGPNRLLPQFMPMRRRIGKGARELAATFTWEHIAQRTVNEVFRPLAAR